MLYKPTQTKPDIKMKSSWRRRRKTKPLHRRYVCVCVHWINESQGPPTHSFVCITFMTNEKRWTNNAMHHSRTLILRTWWTNNYKLFNLFFVVIVVVVVASSLSLFTFSLSMNVPDVLLWVELNSRQNPLHWVTNCTHYDLTKFARECLLMKQNMQTYNSI